MKVSPRISMRTKPSGTGAGAAELAEAPAAISPAMRSCSASISAESGAGVLATGASLAGGKDACLGGAAFWARAAAMAW